MFGIVVIGSALFAPSPGSRLVHLHSLLLQVLVVFGLPFGFSQWRRIDFRSAFRLAPTSFRNVLLSTLLALCLTVLLEEIYYWQFKLTGVSAVSTQQIQQLLKADSSLTFFWILLSMVIVPAFCEEFLFRGFILNRFLAQSGVGQSVMMSAILFGLFHRNLQSLFPFTLAGALLAWIVLRSGSLYNGIVAHGLVNAWAIVISNTGLSAHLPWIEQTAHVPPALQLICLLGIILGGKQLKDSNPTHSYPPAAS